jgi:Lon protease-like protein
MVEQNAESGGQTVELPLFPLNLVLFPGMPLPLHIFEERYKKMIGDCLDSRSPFGVVLIREGQEVGGGAIPFRMGTSARILQVERMEDGRMNLITQGERRFQVVEMTQQMPHLVSQVEFMEESAGNIEPGMLAEIGEAYSTYLGHLSSLAGGWSAGGDSPTDPSELSYRVASSLDLPTNLRQTLLEAPTAGQRLERLLPLLVKGNETLATEVAKRNPFQGPRLN